MSSLSRLGLLLIILAVVAEPGSFPHQSHLKHELKRPALSVPGIMRDWYQEHTQVSPASRKAPKWQRNPVFCCVCQDVITQTKPKIDQKIETKIITLCNHFIPNVKLKCLKLGREFKYKFLKSLFPGRTPRDTCQKIKLCMYKPPRQEAMSQMQAL